jgi:replicative DNA helicase Mcm
VGDPGVAKSQILKFISDLAPKGRYIVGKAASGAGITATVVKDEFLRGWALEAGAMVLANKGLICIDELEKMDPTDRSAMHEALEQQTVTISKANIQATLQAQTSVLAAGNPKLGRFEPFQTIAQQIDLPPTLINRFDVIFILRDMPDKFRDEAIAAHVLSQYQKDDRIIPVERDLFRKFVAYAKQKIKPILTDEAVKEIRDFYVKMRNAPVSADAAGTRSVPISARQLESLVRLAEAHAKLRLSKKVTKEDSKIAIDIIKFYLMQVGYDPETKSFDIDRIAVGVSSSQRSKVILLREMLSKLEERLGKFIPEEELQKELEGKMSKDEIDDAIQKLKASGDVFIPRKGFVQRI